jgi:hypothetical protein
MVAESHRDRNGDHNQMVISGARPTVEPQRGTSATDRVRMVLVAILTNHRGPGSALIRFGAERGAG